MDSTMTYSYIIENLDWLEDAKRGRFSRYAIDGEDSVWVDHDLEIIADPDDPDDDDDNDADD